LIAGNTSAVLLNI